MEELKNLKISTYRLTIEGIDLTIQRGEVFGFAGLEGSGQKLVLQACAGILHPEAGQILIDGTNTTGWSFHKLQNFGVAYVSAGRLEEGLVGDLTSTEHVVRSMPQHKFLVDWKGSRVETQKRSRNTRSWALQTPPQLSFPVATSSDCCSAC